MEQIVAKSGKTTRVHQLAKQLGVSSKDIIAKCEAEDIPGITNHMSAVSLGLAATITEWFSGEGGGTATAVETAAPVDVEAVRKKAARKASRKKAATGAKAAKAAPAAPAPPATEAPATEAPATEAPPTAAPIPAEAR